MHVRGEQRARARRGYAKYAIYVVDRSGNASMVKEWPAKPNRTMTPSGHTDLKIRQIKAVEIRDVRHRRDGAAGHPALTPLSVPQADGTYACAGSELSTGCNRAQRGQPVLSEAYVMVSDAGVPAEVLAAECDRLLDFGRHLAHPRGGAAWLDERGRPDLTRPVFTWITARMTHVYCLGHLLGRSGDAELAAQGLSGLLGRLRDEQSGGWFTSIDDDGDSPDEKAGYTHAFVVLAASSARTAALQGADTLLEEALAVWEEKFFDPDAGMFVDAWDRGFTRLDPYRGLNGNMHAVEALMAAADATGDEGLRERALGIARRVVREFAEPQHWRIPEHFDSQWQPMLEHNADMPDDPFQPYGATVGHGLEWSRLLLHLEASLGEEAPDWLRGIRDRPVRAGGGRRLGCRRGGWVRLHHRLGRSAGGPGPDALGAGRGLSRRRRRCTSGLGRAATRSWPAPGGRMPSDS